MDDTEIDTIFAAIGNHKVPPSSVTKTTGSNKSIKRDPASVTKRPPPETVFDSSSKRAKRDRQDGRRTQNEQLDRFKDSRGSAPRRRTEEGFAIYKEDELGISNQGGDTPSCPFDCQCCF